MSIGDNEDLVEEIEETKTITKESPKEVVDQGEPFPKLRKYATAMKRKKKRLAGTFIIVIIIVIFYNPLYIQEAAGYSIIVDNNVDADSDVDGVDNVGTSEGNYTNAQNLDGIDQNLTEADTGAGGGGGGPVMYKMASVSDLVDGRHYSTDYSNGQTISGHATTLGVSTYKSWEGKWKPASERQVTYRNTSYMVGYGTYNATDDTWESYTPVPQYEVDAGSFKTSFTKTNSTITGDGWGFTQRPSKLFLYNWNTEAILGWQNFQAPSTFTYNASSGQLRYMDIFSNTHLYFGYNGSTIKEVFRATTLPDNYPISPWGQDATYLVIDTIILDHYGFNLADDSGNIAEDTNKTVIGRLKLIDAYDEIKAYMPTGTAWAWFDETGANESTDVKTRLVNVDGDWHLYTAINYTLFTHPLRDGNVYIDPTWTIGSGGEAWDQCTFVQTMENTTTNYAQLYPTNVTGNITSPVRGARNLWLKIQYEGSLPAGTNVSIYYNSSSDNGISDPYSMQLVTDLAASGTNYTLPAEEKYGSWRLILNTNNTSNTPLIYNVTLFNEPPNTAWWSLYKDIEINSDKVSGTGSHTDFPVLIYLPSDSDLAADAQDDGDDIAFANATAWLDHEIETFDGSTGKLIAWVRIPTLSTSSNTTISMYYGNATMGSQQNPSGVWNATYAGVWHLNETAKTDGSYNDVMDSTSNNNDGESTGSNMDVTLRTELNGADDFDGTADYVELGTDSSIGVTTYYTFSAWIDYDGDAVGVTQTIFANGADGGAYTQFAIDSSGVFGIRQDAGTSAWGDTVLSNGLQYLVVTKDGDSGTNVLFYLNGSSDGTDVTGAFGATGEKYIGVRGETFPSHLFYGEIDELHVTNNVHSADWVATEWNNQDDYSTFFELGSETPLAIPEEDYVENVNDDNAPSDSGDITNWTNMQEFDSHLNATFIENDIGDTEDHYDSESSDIDSSADAGTQTNPTYANDSVNSQYMNIEETEGLPVLESWDVAGSSSASTTMTVDKPTGVELDDLLVLIAMSEANGFVTVFDSTGNNNFTFLGQGGSADSDAYIGIYYHIANGTEDSTETVTALETAEMMVYYLRISGVNTTNPIDVSAFGLGGSATSHAIGGVTTTKNNTLVFYGLAFDGGDGFPFSVAGAGFVEVDDAQYGAASGDISGTFGTKSMEDYGASGTATVTSSVSDGAGWVQFAVAPNTTISAYSLDLEYSWTGADYDETNEEVAIYVQEAVQDGENLTAWEWTGSAWASLGELTSDGWNNFTASYLTSATYYIKLNDTGLDLDTEDWNIDLITLHTWSTPLYKFNREGGWENTNYTNNNEELCIYVDYIDSLENLTVSVWNGTAWIYMFDLSAAAHNNTWVNTSVTTWLTGSAFEIQFLADSESSDTVQSTWSIDAVLLHTWVTAPGVNYTLTWEHQSQNVDTQKDAYYLTIYGWSDDSGVSGHPTNGTDFSNYKTITVDNTKVSGTSHTNFQVLVNMYDTDLKNDAQSDGDDIRFSNSTTWYDHEIERFDQSYNSTHAHLVAWVEIPTLSGSSDTIFRMYYGNSSIIAQENPEGVWDASYGGGNGLYKGVYHLSEDPTGTIYDSTANNNDATDGGSMTSDDLIDAQIGKGLDFTYDSSQYLEIDDSEDFNMTNSLTISVWVKVPADVLTAGEYHIVAHNYFWEDNGYVLMFRNGDLEFRVKNGTDSSDLIVSDHGIVADTWNHIIAYTTAPVQLLYVNGTQVGVGSFTSYINNTISVPVRIGRSAAGDFYFNGSIDEIRISNMSTSVDWKVTQYNNQYSPITFYSVGSETPVAERFDIQLWNNTDSIWINTDYYIEGDEKWYNFSIGNFSGVIGVNITWRYLDNDRTSDTIQTTLRIDYAGVNAYNMTIYGLAATHNSLVFSADNDYHAFADSPLSFVVESGTIYDIRILGIDATETPVADGYIYWNSVDNSGTSMQLTTSWVNFLASQAAGNTTFSLYLWVNYSWSPGDAALVNGTYSYTVNVSIIGS